MKRYLVITIHDNDFWTELEYLGSVITHWRISKDEYTIDAEFTAVVGKALTMIIEATGMLHRLRPMCRNQPPMIDDYVNKHIKVYDTDEEDPNWDNCECLVIDTVSGKYSVR